MTFDECVEKAVQSLNFAMDESDLAKMARYESIADSWTNLAALISSREYHRDE